MKNRWKNIGMNLLGSMLLAFGICAFIEPFGLIVGGATGISLIIHRLTGIQVSLVSMFINVGVLPFGLIFGGKKLFAGSILSSIAAPAFIAVFEKFPQICTIADTTLLAAICGGISCGFGVGLVMKSGGSTGGLDIPILLVHKIIKVPVGRMMNAVDSCIMIGQIPLFGLNAIIYGLIFTYIMTNSLNTLLTLGEDCIRVSVISEKYGEMRDALIANDFGLTFVYTESGYTRTQILKIESIMRSEAYRKAKDIIEGVDPEAFVTIEKVKSVRGRGFTMERIPIDLE